MGIVRQVPDYPRLPFDIDLLRTWGHLLLEELWEYFDAAGLDVVLRPGHNGDSVQYADMGIMTADRRPDLVGIVDACADVAVVNTGVLSLCGVADISVMQEVNNNNLLKVDPSRGAKVDLNTGKLRKPPGHPKPDFASVLRNQGWRQVSVNGDHCNGSGTVSAGTGGEQDPDKSEP
jgi:predicted HAD superfamily Cof-like phosphohydrolase